MQLMPGQMVYIEILEFSRSIWFLPSSTVGAGPPSLTLWVI